MQLMASVGRQGSHARLGGCALHKGTWQRAQMEADSRPGCLPCRAPPPPRSRQDALTTHNTPCCLTAPGPIHLHYPLSFYSLHIQDTVPWPLCENSSSFKAQLDSNFLRHLPGFPIRASASLLCTFSTTHAHGFTACSTPLCSSWLTGPCSPQTLIPLKTPY